MKLKPENRLALLEAFARSKGYEFRGFTAIWLVGHPEAAEDPVVVAPPEVATPIPEPVVDERFQSDPDATLTFTEKPKRRRRKEVATDV